MNISGFCIKHRVTTLLAFIMISIFGVIFTTQLQLALIPDMEAPMAVVACYYNGASPSDMEELVTRPLEAAIMSVSGVEGVQSSSSDGMTQIQVTYAEGTNLDIAATKLRENFNAVNLPDGAIDPIIMNMNISDLMPSAMIALMGEDLANTQTLAEDTVAPALERIEGVASVSISGGVSNQIAVEVDVARAAGYGLSNSYIAQILAAQNLLYPGGEVDNGTQSMTVTTDAKFQTVEDVANMVVPLPTGGVIRLSEVANVAMEITDPDSIAKMGEKSAVILQVSKQSGANEVKTANAVAEAMEEMKKENPSIHYLVVYLASDYINLAVVSAIQNIILGVVLAAIVVFIFLRRFGPTLAIGVSMPVCILTVFVLMNAFDITMNMMSLGGIAMGVGMIVDNSIVVLENIYRYFAEGHDRKTSCIEGTKEVMTSLTASTLTTVAVFLPLGLAGGVAGMLFDDFCLTISFLILGSLVIAITLVPLLCYMLLDEDSVRKEALRRAAQENKKSAELEKLMVWYKKVLAYFTNHLGQGVLISMALVAVFVVACLNTNMVLLPEMDQGSVNIMVSTPTGSDVEYTSRISEAVAKRIEEYVPEMDNVYYLADSESSTVYLNLIDRKERDRSAAQIADDLRPHLNDIAGAEISVDTTGMEAMLGSGSEISIDITGKDNTTLAMIANDLVAQISQLPDAVDLTTTLSKQVPQVKVTMNREAAAQYGLTAATVGAAVRSELTGSTATTVTIDNKEIDVVVRGDGASSASLDALRSMPVSSAFGGMVPLSAVADVEVVMMPQSINRANQTRQVSVTGSTISGNVTAITKEIRAILDSYPLPEGYVAEISGSYTSMMESFNDLLLALVVALGLVYFVLASQFESFLMPVIVMMILPITFSGALFALPVTGRDLSMISLVALIMLAGTVVNASIILVDYINIRRERGESREEAIVNACPLRVRPVLMTTITTVLAMVPMALAMGDTIEMMSDMGITMMSGMIISTVVTLFFTPVYYSVIDKFSEKVSEKFSRKKKSNTEEVQPV